MRTATLLAITVFFMPMTTVQIAALATVLVATMLARIGAASLFDECPYGPEAYNKMAAGTKMFAAEMQGLDGDGDALRSITTIERRYRQKTFTFCRWCARCAGRSQQ